MSVLPGGYKQLWERRKVQDPQFCKDLHLYVLREVVQSVCWESHCPLPGTARNPPFLGGIPISHHKIHPGCWCSRKCSPWMEAGRGEGAGKRRGLRHGTPLASRDVPGERGGLPSCIWNQGFFPNDARKTCPFVLTSKPVPRSLPYSST